MAADPVSPGDAPEERAFDYARTVALSDGVFAIALTLLVLNISAPLLTAGHHGDLGHRLVNRESEFYSYALSFAVIALLWLRHHTFFRGLDRIDTRIAVLNLTYLGFVAFLPYPTRILGLYGDQPVAVGLYAATGGVIALLGGFMRVHADRAGLLSAAGRRALAPREHWMVIPAVFLLSIPIAFLSTTVAVLMWALLFFLPARGRARRRMSQRAS